MPWMKKWSGDRSMKSEYVLQQKVLKALDLLTEGNRLVMRVCLDTGLRVGDVLALRTDQIGRQFYITESKTCKRRRVNLSEGLLQEMRDQAGQVWVFEGRTGGSHRTRQAVWKDLKRAARALRIEKNLTPHSARKAYAVRLMEKYGDLEKVQRALNHDNAAVTVIYALADKLPERKRRRAK